MKATTETIKGFEPVKLTITLETQQEVNLYHAIGAKIATSQIEQLFRNNGIQCSTEQIVNAFAALGQQLYQYADK